MQYVVHGVRVNPFSHVLFNCEGRVREVVDAPALLSDNGEPGGYTYISIVYIRRVFPLFGAVCNK